MELNGLIGLFIVSKKKGTALGEAFVQFGSGRGVSLYRTYDCAAVVPNVAKISPSEEKRSLATLIRDPVQESITSFGANRSVMNSNNSKLNFVYFDQWLLSLLPNQHLTMTVATGRHEWPKEEQEFKFILAQTVGDETTIH